MNGLPAAIHAARSRPVRTPLKRSGWPQSNRVRLSRHVPGGETPRASVDAAVVDHPRYRAWERHHLLIATRMAAATLAIVLLGDVAALAPRAPGLLLVNVPGAAVALGLVLVLRRGGEARRNPWVGFYLVGALCLVTNLLPQGLIEGMQFMVGYVPIVLLASALFSPWRTSWHVAWLITAVASVVAFAVSPYCRVLDAEARTDLILLTVASGGISLAGHLVLQRQRQSMFQQRLQLRALNQTALRQRRELESLTADLEAAARNDPLTGLGNRLRLGEEIEALEQSLAASDESAAAIMIDIDRFKGYNDREGHIQGDRALRLVSAVISGHVRAEDHVFRFGGEEILVLLPGLDETEALAAADRVREAVFDLGIDHPGNPPWGALTISAGVTGIHPGPADDWLRAADEALYASKARGRNRTSASGRFAAGTTAAGRGTKALGAAG